VAPAGLRRPAECLLGGVVGRHRIPGRLGAVVARKGKALFPHTWDENHVARIGVMARESTGEDVRWLRVSRCFVFHVLNAYDEGSNVVIDVVRHPKAFDVNRLGPNEGVPVLERWTIDDERGVVTEDCLDDRAQEFPRADERRLGRPYRFGYAIAHEQSGGALAPTGTLVKHDLCGGRSARRRFEDARLDEFVFVPASSDAEEDEGILMGYVYRAEAGTSDLVLLHSTTLELVAAVHLPVRVPHGFHGNWLPTM
jgi:carotenoid cleavage dioxygenase